MSQKQIIIDISPAGTTTVEAKGFNGQGCDKATELIEIAIGGGGQKKKSRKPEYYSGTGGKIDNKQVF